MFLKHVLRKPFLILGVGLLLLCGMSAWYWHMYRYLPEEVPPPLNPRYRDASLPTEERIDALLASMTLREKVGQMALVEKNSVWDKRDMSTYGIGGILSGAGAKPDDNTVGGWRDMVNQFDTASRASRLGIPALYGADATHGHGGVPGATVFPHFIGLGASGDSTLVRDIARATGDEIRDTGITWSYSPTLDMPKDVRWGRVYETFSDDPALVSRLGVAYLEGLQGAVSTTTQQKFSVLGTLKHYIGAGSMAWGSSSNKNFHIDQGTTPADSVRLPTYLNPFKAGVDAGALSVMVGLNSWGETKLSGEKHLIQDTLKDQLGFKGFVVSDWYSVYEIPGGKYNASVTAINAGVDMVMLPFEYQTFVQNVMHAVAEGDISQGRIDDAVRRILRAKFALGLFDREGLTPDTHSLGSREHRAVARKAVAESLVLLKNEHDVLPLRKDVGLLRVAGGSADNIGKQAGAWTVEWQGIDGNWLPGATSILAGLREVAPKNTKIEFDEKGNFSKDAPLADVGLAIVGEKPYAEGWGDTALPILGAEDLETIARLRAVSRTLVVVLVTGRPLLITGELPKWDGLVSAWLPGSEGAGVADVLFGKKSFTGTLPLPWPATLEQVPIKEDESTTDGSETLLPRFFGLRY